ncbi:MAG: hypothetical protein ABI442_05790 [Gemmatimonadaceae bacterium]
MSLERARTKLGETLREVDLGALGEEVDDAIIQIIDDWFAELKAEESKDTFAAAFAEHRMTARVVKKEGGVIEAISMNKYDLAEREAAPDKTSTPDAYNTGVAGMKLRTDPSNFGAEVSHAGGMRKVDGKIVKVAPTKKGKYTLGLHDLSAVLLSTKRGNILNQLAWKEGAQETAKNAVVFMPLPLEADLQIFALLSAKVKAHRIKHNRIAAKLADVRHKMTRVKLTNEDDAGSGFVNVGTGWTNKQRKYRYGLGLIPIEGKEGKTGVDEMDRRRALALEYRSMLGKMKPMPEDTTLNPTHNELVVAYRHHASNCFPLFTEYEKARNCWRVVDGPQGFNPLSIGTAVPARIFQDGTVG